MNLTLQFLKLGISGSKMKLVCSSVCLLSRNCFCSNTNSSQDSLALFTDYLIQRRLDKSLDAKDTEASLTSINYKLSLKQHMNDDLELMNIIKKYLQKYLNRQEVPATPPMKLLNSLAYYFIKRNNLEGLQLIIDVHKLDYAEFTKHGEYNHYLIDYYSHNNQLDKSFDIIYRYYACHKEVNYLMKFSIRKMIDNVVANRSEAALVKLINHVKRFSTESQDFYPLLILWRNLFSSSWYTDQTEAKDLFHSHHMLQVYVSMMCVNFSLELLSKKRVNAVQSLLEYFLKLRNDSGIEKKYDKQCMLILRALFDYQCMAQNLQACTEIVKTSYELELPLSEEQRIQFFNILLRKPIERKLITPLHKNIYPLKF